MDDFEHLCALNVEPGGHVKRPHCSGCLRPCTACWCPWVPKPPLTTRTNFLILQHPYEERRKVRTARILEQSISPTNIRLVRGRRFNEQRFPELIPILTGEQTYVLYPHPNAIPADLCKPETSCSNRWLVVLDGTWTQARNMLSGCPLLLALKKVCLPPDAQTGCIRPSQFVVRRQPFAEAVSTVEAVARVLDLWEPHESITDYYQTQLLRPLHRICAVQQAWKCDESNTMD